MSETRSAPAVKLRYFTLLIAWDDSDTEQGEFGWGGWAANEDEAERFARAEMAENDQCDNEPGEAGEFGGHLIDCTEGANCYAAPRAAALLAELLDTGATGFSRVELQAVLDILRPPEG